MTRRPSSLTWLVIGVLNLLLGQVAVQAANISDLPACAQPCALTSAIAAGCSLTDQTCLCTHPNFAQATFQCSNAICTLADRAAVGQVLGSLCPSQPAPTTSSSSASSSTATASSASSTSTSSTASSASQTSQSAATTSQTTTATKSSTTALSTPLGTSSTQLTPSGSTTVVVVQTIDVPQPTETSGALRSQSGVTGATTTAGGILALLISLFL